MIRLRQQGQREAKRLWTQVRPEALDATFPLGPLELTVTTLQREAARLSSGYLSAFIASELGEPERPPAVSVWDRAFGGGDLREALRSAIINAKQRIGEGMAPREAVNASRAILVSDVGLFIDTAARESLRQGMEQDERVVGYQRALKGTCGACAGDVAVETSVELPSVPLQIHPNCFPAGTEVSGPRARAATTRWYAGDLVELRLVDDLLACTPNHPILTPRGWVAAERLCEGDDVIRSLGPQRSVIGVDPDHDEGPALIEQVAEALRGAGSVSSVSVPVAPEDFHGDGTGGDVDVVWADCLRQRRIETALGEHLREPALCLGCMGLLALAGLSALDLGAEGIALAAAGGMSSSGIGTALGGPELGISQALGFAHSSQDAGFAENAVDRNTGDAVPSRDRLLTFADEIQTDKLLAVRRIPFRGHVYNLQTEGWYAANGVIVANCQCVTEPVVQTDRTKPLTQAEKTRLQQVNVTADLDDPATRELVRAVLDLPDDVLKRLNDLGIRIELSGSKSLGEMRIGRLLDEFGKKMAGVSRGQDVAISRAGRGPETVWHELGHFLDKNAGLHRADLFDFQQQLIRTQMGMGHRWLMPGGSGNAEMWADTFAAYVKGGREGIIKAVGSKMAPKNVQAYADWAEKEALRLAGG